MATFKIHLLSLIAVLTLFTESEAIFDSSPDAVCKTGYRIQQFANCFGWCTHYNFFMAHCINHVCYCQFKDSEGFYKELSLKRVVEEHRKRPSHETIEQLKKQVELEETKLREGKDREEHHEINENEIEEQKKKEAAEEQRRREEMQRQEEQRRREEMQKHEEMKRREEEEMKRRREEEEMKRRREEEEEKKKEEEEGGEESDERLVQHHP